MASTQAALKLDPPETADHGSTHLMSGGPNQNGLRTPGNQHATPDLRNAYEQIGSLLETAEAAHIGVGIHWLPPSSRVRGLRSKCHGNLDEFLRTGLVSVPTHFLESYLEDLDTLTCDKATKEYLYINGPTFFERFALVMLVVIVLIVSGAGFGQTMAHESNLTSELWWIGGVLGIGAFVGTSMCSERMRRQSFMSFIEAEICRRRGLDHPNMTKLPIHAMKPGPIGE